MLENLRMGFASLWLNKGRSFLTMLGIIIGVASVILIFSIAQGVRSDVTKSIEGLGTNIIFVVPGKFQPGRFINPGAFSSVLTEKDVETVKDVKGVKDVSPLNIVSNISKAGNRTDNIATNAGVADTLPKILNLSVEKGRFLNKKEVDNGELVAVLGSEPANALFPKGDAIGQTVMIKDKQLKIVGVMKSVPTTIGGGGANFDAMIWLPFTTAQNKLASTTIARIAVTAESGGEVDAVKDRITQAIKKNHGVDDFTVLTQEDIVSTATQILDSFASLIASIAAISVIVGGIGIMNMMLVSVTERTREIGIRKAVGATRGSILAQFLTEAVVLSFVGAILGLLAALAVAFIVDRASENLNPVFTPISIVLALVMAFFVGIIFGIAPAARAAAKDPIEALRYE